MDAKQIMVQAEKYREEMIKFMRDMIKIPSESRDEGKVIQRIKEEMELVGFDEIKIDEMGNILGRVGNGKHVIAMDAHIDTVGIGDLKEWDYDPYEGKIENDVIFGRGASDQEGGMVGMVYAAKVIKDLGLEGDYTLWVTGTVNEEDCDGQCWEYILKEKVIEPEVVVITEPTNLNIYRGHRGRMEIAVSTYGRACHGSAPERGVNAIFMMAKIANEVELLNDRLKDDAFLGKGTVTVSYIDCETPSLCAVPNKSYIHLDRRLTDGETKESAVAEVEDAVRKAGFEIGNEVGQAFVEILQYDEPSYTGFAYPVEKYYPTWVLAPEHRACKSAVDSFKAVLGTEPVVDKWTFSTNGVSTMGLMGVPTIGFGPANEIYAHTVLDQVPIDHLVKACAFYAAFPTTYVNTKE
ncbi:MAG: YgeY family selenium metabolism-linked hydrolase [Bacteriovoracaceae bacterium]|nr:YgeY family selenium metabolism-linked hydrolase [Bacteriovoracaceae bacterium]